MQAVCHPHCFLNSKTTFTNPNRQSAAPAVGRRCPFGRKPWAFSIKATASAPAQTDCRFGGFTLAEGALVPRLGRRNRWDEARTQAANAAIASRDLGLAERIRKFQFRDIRPKAATDIDDLTAASKLLGYSKEQITKTVYRRLG